MKMDFPKVDLDDKKLDFPPENPFIAEHFDLFSSKYTGGGRTEMVMDKESDNFWMNMDTKFDTPKAIINFKIYTNSSGLGTSPKASVLARVWADCVREHLRETSYMASCAKLNDEISLSADSINFHFSGFNDKLDRFTVDMIKKMRDLKESKHLHKIFRGVKEIQLNDYKNHHLTQPYTQISSIYNAVMMDQFHPFSEDAKILEKLTYKDFREFLAEWLTHGNTMMYIHGNMPQFHAMSLNSEILHNLQLDYLKPADIPKIRTLDVP